MADLMRALAETRDQVRVMERDHRRETEGLLVEVMDIADGVERMQKTLPPEIAAQLQAVVAQIQELLGARELVAYRPAVGSDVDGRTCEVMATVERSGLRPGTVTAVLRSGYRGGDRVVRRAGVEIVKEQA
jgi:molecular chaperone GrpE (heat shock protein)